MSYTQSTLTVILGANVEMEQGEKCGQVTDWCQLGWPAPQCQSLPVRRVASHRSHWPASAHTGLAAPWLPAPPGFSGTPAIPSSATQTFNFMDLFQCFSRTPATPSSATQTFNFMGLFQCFSETPAIPSSATQTFNFMGLFQCFSGTPATPSSATHI